MAEPENTRGMLIDNCPVTFPAHDHTEADKTRGPMRGRHGGQAANKEPDVSKSIMTLNSLFSYFMSDVIHILARCLFLDPYM